jgi:peptide/nickel transport system substrate-binding protein
MKRRAVLQSAIAGAAALAAPRIGRAAGSTTLKFVPQADLANLDPIWSTSDVSRNHGHAVFDTLYGIDAKFAPHPQMAAGATMSADGKTWDITLRDGLTFHDGTPVLGRDVVASLQRWGKRDAFGGVLFAATDELSAPTDKTIRFRLNKPFALLPDALASSENMAAIMPERLAKTDPYQQVTEMVGSGPFRFVASERVSGARVVYEKFAGYVPRPDGVPSYTSGPKIAHVDRVEWTVVPDPSTSAAALDSGEFDWWENPVIDLVPQLKRNRDITVVVKDPTGEMGCMRFNQLFPPFDNPAIRHLVLSAVSQQDAMDAVAGADPSLIKVPVGLFATGTPMASDAGLDMMKGVADPGTLKAALAAAGYKGEKVVILAASDFPTINAMAQVGGDLLKRMGFNVDYQALDWGTVVARRASKEPVDKGGWNVFFTFLGGTGNISPASHLALRSNGGKAWFGWPDLPKVEALRLAWFDAPDVASQQKICRELQVQALTDVPYVPMGMYYMPTAFRNTISGIPDGFPQFYGVKKAV